MAQEKNGREGKGEEGRQLIFFPKYRAKKTYHTLKNRNMKNTRERRINAHIFQFLKK